MSKGFSKFIVILILLVIIGFVVYFVFFNKEDYTDLSDIDLNEYTLSSVKIDNEYYVNEPQPTSGTLVFKNADGDELKARLKEAEIEGFDTTQVGEYIMTISVSTQSVQVKYIVKYKNVEMQIKDAIRLTLNNPFELNTLYILCYDYNDSIVDTVPMSSLDWTNLDVGTTTNIEYQATTEFNDEYLSFDYTVGYIGYGYTYNGIEQTTSNLFVINQLIINAESTGYLDITSFVGNTSVVNEEFNEQVTWEYVENYSSNTKFLRLLNTSGQTVGEYYFETNSLRLYPNVCGNNEVIDIEIKLKSIINE